MLSDTPDLRLALLADRGVVSVRGDEGVKLLQGLLTSDLDQLDSRTAVHAGLLSPQGKILFEMLVMPAADGGLMLDVARDMAADLVKRLTLYRLRAKADIEDVSDKFQVAVAWSGGQPVTAPSSMVYADPRHAGLGTRWLVPLADAAGLLPVADHRAAAAAYHAHRIALAIPEGGKDYEFADAFAHEANFDLTHSVSFTKGCYVGQEIVARMQHRGTARKRVIGVTGGRPLPADRPDVKMGEVTIGRLGSVAGPRGLALLRLDRAIEAIDMAATITAGGIDLQLDDAMIARHRKLMADKAGRT